MARKATTYAKLLKMAKSYGVEKNELFVQAAEQYDTQMRVIQSIKDALDAAENLTTFIKLRRVILWIRIKFSPFTSYDLFRLSRPNSRFVLLRFGFPANILTYQLRNVQ